MKFSDQSTTQGHRRMAKPCHKSTRGLTLFCYVKLNPRQIFKLGQNRNTTWQIPQQASKVILHEGKRNEEAEAEGGRGEKGKQKKEEEEEDEEEGGEGRRRRRKRRKKKKERRRKKKEEEEEEEEGGGGGRRRRRRKRRRRNNKEQEVEDEEEERGGRG